MEYVLKTDSSYLRPLINSYNETCLATLHPQQFFAKRRQFRLPPFFIDTDYVEITQDLYRLRQSRRAESWRNCADYTQAVVRGSDAKSILHFRSQFSESNFKVNI